MMQWEKLLAPKRIRELLGGTPSNRDRRDLRTEFERDYDRAVFSTPVRRLQDKAQVFPLESHDFVRTRLTHSQEVSAVARGLGKATGLWLLGAGHLRNAAHVNDIATIAATCGLIHDLGNPPFGHFGEDAISDWFSAQPEGFFAGFGAQKELVSDFTRFDGNAQTLRLISKLQILADQHGLNLTVGTFSAARKYVCGSNSIDETDEFADRAKTGNFASEQALVDLIAAETGTGAARNPITLLVEAADDIVYSTGDLADGVKKGVVAWPTVDAFLRQVPACVPIVDNATATIDASGLTGRERDQAVAQLFAVGAANECVYAVLDAFKNHYDSIMNGDYHRSLIKDSTARTIVKTCKDIGKQHVYVSNETLKLEVMGYRVIQDLLDTFWAHGIAKDYTKKGSLSEKLHKLMSENYKRVMRESLRTNGGVLPEQYFKLQLVTDYVCGMTDTFALTLHHELNYGAV